MPGSAPDGPGPESAAARDRAFALVPRLLVALAGACALSGAAGVAWVASGRGAPPTPALLVPPALVLAAAPLLLLRAGRRDAR